MVAVIDLLMFLMLETLKFLKKKTHWVMCIICLLYNDLNLLRFNK